MGLQVSHLKKSYGGRPVVNNVSFSMDTGEIVALLGPNGAGKTTAFYSVVGIIQPDAGQVTLDGISLTGRPIHERARAGIGYLTQETSVFRKLSVEDNLRLVLEFQTLSPRQINQRIDELLEEFGLERVRKTSAIQLSGGERRRIEIARAIAANPQYLLLDEPFAGIDPLAVQDIQKLIILLKERGLGILLTDHNPEATLTIADRAYIIHDGQVIFSGTCAEVISNEMVQKNYLGEGFRLSEPAIASSAGTTWG